jgi:hypothetical protein
MDTFDTTVKVVARRAPLGRWWCWHYFRFGVNSECRVTHRAGDRGQSKDGLICGLTSLALMNRLSPIAR